MPGGKHILGKQNPQRVFGTAKVGEKGQIVIPREARALFGIRPGDTLLLVGDAESGIVITKPQLLSDLADEVLANINRNGEERNGT